MVKISEMIDSDEELPELSILLWRKAQPKQTTTPVREYTKNTVLASSRKREEVERIVESDHSNFALGDSTEAICHDQPLCSLKFANINHPFLPRGNQPLNATCDINVIRENSPPGHGLRSSPRRLAKTPVDYSKFTSTPLRASPSFSDDYGSFTDAAGSIVPDSADDDDDDVVISQRKSRRRRQDQQFSQLGPLRQQGDLVFGYQNAPWRKPKILEVTHLRSPGPQTPPEVLELCEWHSEIDEPFSRLKL